MPAQKTRPSTSRSTVCCLPPPATVKMQTAAAASAVASGSASQNNTTTFQIPPIISLHFEELKREIQQFGATFNDWIGEKRRMLTDDKETYLKTLAEEADAVEGLKKQYSQLQAKKQAIIQAIETEEREHDEMLRTNGELREQRNQLSVRLSQMKQQIEVLHAEISREGTIYTQNEAKKEEMLSKSRSELADFQRHLGLYIEPLLNNQTRFTFLHIDPTHPTDRPCSFVVDVSQEKYRVLSCEPAIPEMRVLVDELNGHRDFYRFLKTCRQSFVRLFV